MRTLLLTIFLNLQLFVTAQIDPNSITEPLLDGASNVTELSGGYTYAVVLQSAVIIILLFVTGYLYVDKRKSERDSEEYLREITKEAITSVTKSAEVLATIEKKQERLEIDHDQIKDGISNIKGRLT